MALLFQSNPDQWDLRRFFKPGERESWFVNRYLSHMRPGVLTLLWEAQGSQALAVRGLYGWGITLGEPASDKRGRLRIPLQYVERWVSAADAERGVPDSDHVAAVPAREILSLPSWQQHPLNKMPVGTNFIILADQLRDLAAIVQERYPDSAFGRATEIDTEGKPLVANDFEKRYVKQKVATR